MLQAGQSARLPLETCGALGIAREFTGQDLQRDLAAELGVLGPV